MEEPVSEVLDEIQPVDVQPEQPGVAEEDDIHKLPNILPNLAVFMFIMLLMFGKNMTETVREIRWIDSLTATASAVVTDVERIPHEHRDEETTYTERPSFRFATKDGAEHVSSAVDETRAGVWQAGDEAIISYSPDDPDRGCLVSEEVAAARLKRQQSIWQKILLFVMLIPLEGFQMVLEVQRRRLQKQHRKEREEKRRQKRQMKSIAKGLGAEVAEKATTDPEAADGASSGIDNSGSEEDEERVFGTYDDDSDDGDMFCVIQ